MDLDADPSGAYPQGMAMAKALSPDEIRRGVSDLVWFHKIDLGCGIITPGTADFTWRPDQLPEFTGRSVLDIGAWDGGYSFLAEQRGASRVVALDHYAWGVNFGARDQYWDDCRARGVLPDHARDVRDFWTEERPGQRAFNFAHSALNSRVEPVLDDFSTMDLETLGQFDVVLYLGVLYHMPEPLTSLERVHRVTKDVAAIETVAIDVPGRNEERLVQFNAGDEVGSDFGNWFIPSTSALVALCRAAGFTRVDVIVGPPSDTQPPSSPVAPSLRYRIGQVIHPSAPPLPGDLPYGLFRTLVHAYVS